MLEDQDSAILKSLERDGRLGADDLATMLGMDVSEVKQRVAQLERDKFIKRYKAVVNWEKAGDERVLALIEVRVSPQRDVGFDSVAERIFKFPEARTVYLVSGTYDLLVQVAGRSMQEVSSFVAEKLSPIEGVQGTVTHFLLKRYKEDGDVMAELEVAKRLPMSF